MDPETGETQLGSDAELITRVRTGDRAAFGELYRRHAAAATALARQFGRSATEADDLVSESFARVLDGLLAGGGPDTAFRAYLFTTLRNTAYDKTRKDRRLQFTDDLTAHEVAVDGPDPVIAMAENGLIGKAFASLPERWQTVLWHTQVEGQSPAEVGLLLGMAPNAVTSLAFRAREGLREAYLQAHLAETAAERCRATVDRLGAWARGGLSKRERAMVDGHLAECDSCSGLAAELTQINSSLRLLLAPLLLGGLAAGYLATLGGVAVLTEAGALAGAGSAAGTAITGTTAGGAAAGGSNGVATLLSRPWGIGAGVVAAAAAVVVAIVIATTGGGSPGPDSAGQQSAAVVSGSTGVNGQGSGGGTGLNGSGSNGSDGTGSNGTGANPTDVNGTGANDTGANATGTGADGTGANGTGTGANDTGANATGTGASGTSTDPDGTNPHGLPVVPGDPGPQGAPTAPGGPTQGGGTPSAPPPSSTSPTSDTAGPGTTPPGSSSAAPSTPVTSAPSTRTNGPRTTTPRPTTAPPTTPRPPTSPPTTPAPTTTPPTTPPPTPAALQVTAGGSLSAAAGASASLPVTIRNSGGLPSIADAGGLVITTPSGVTVSGLVTGQGLRAVQAFVAAAAPDCTPDGRTTRCRLPAVQPRAAVTVTLTLTVAPDATAEPITVQVGSSTFTIDFDVRPGIAAFHVTGPETLAAGSTESASISADLVAGVADPGTIRLPLRAGALWVIGHPESCVAEQDTLVCSGTVTVDQTGAATADFGSFRISALPSATVADALVASVPRGERVTVIGGDSASPITPYTPGAPVTMDGPFGGTMVATQTMQCSEPFVPGARIFDRTNCTMRELKPDEATRSVRIPEGASVAWAGLTWLAGEAAAPGSVDSVQLVVSGTASKVDGADLPMTCTGACPVARWQDVTAALAEGGRIAVSGIDAAPKRTSDSNPYPIAGWTLTVIWALPGAETDPEVAANTVQFANQLVSNTSADPAATTVVAPEGDPITELDVAVWAADPYSVKTMTLGGQTLAKTVDGVVDTGQEGKPFPVCAGFDLIRAGGTDGLPITGDPRAAVIFTNQRAGNVGDALWIGSTFVVRGQPDSEPPAS